MAVSIPYSPSRRRQWVGIAFAALLCAPLLWKPAPRPHAIAPVSSIGESAHSFEEVRRSAPSTYLAAAAPTVHAAHLSTHGPEPRQ